MEMEISNAELKKITGVKAEKLKDKSYIKVTISGMVVKQRGFSNLWLLIVGDNTIQRGKNIEEIFQKLGYNGNIRYNAKKKRRKNEKNKRN